MKKIKYIVLVLLCFLAFKTEAQAPEGINYQAVMRKSTGAIITNRALYIKIELAQGNISGSTAYAETISTSTNGQGVVNFVIGSGDPIEGNFSNINWGNGPFFLKLFVDFDSEGPKDISNTAHSNL